MPEDGRGRHQITLGLDAESPAGGNVPVRIRRNNRAKRMILRADPAAGEAVVTCPPWVSEAEARAFAAKQAAWIAKQFAKSPPPQHFEPGLAIPFLGVDHVIRHRPDARGGVWRDAGEIHVTGQIEHLPRRLTDWLKREARRQIAPRVDDAAGRLDAKPGRITVRDTKSRWGSCAANGNLSFSWRLVMAPEPVLDYVVAHEVAHLIEHNHSGRFWALVDRLIDDAARQRKWLRDHGPGLHMIGG